MAKSSRSPDPDFIAVLLLLALGIIAYANSFIASFHFDDFRSIVENDALFDFTDLARIYTYCKERFLTYFTLAINYKISGFDTTSYHIFNFFIHYFAALFLYFLFIESWKTPGLHESKPKVPLRVVGFFVAGIFLLHPLQTQAVTYIVQRAESLAGMFYLGAILFYVKGRLSSSRSSSVKYYMLMLLCGLGSAFSKETSVTLPAMIVIYEVLFFKTSLRALLRNKVIYVLFVPAVIVVVYKLGTLVQRDFYYDPGTYFTRKQYFLTQLCVLLTYLRLFFWPANQNLDYDYPVAVTFFHARVIESLLFLLLLVLLAVLAHRKFPLLSLGIIAFFLTLAPTSSIIPMFDLIYEHRMYLAVAFLTMGSVQVVLYGLEKTKTLSPRCPQIVLFVILFSLLPLLTKLTYARNKVWANDLTLWGDVVRKSPNKARPHINFGVALHTIGGGGLESVKKEFEIARDLCPVCPAAYSHLGFVHWKEGDYDGAISMYMEAIERKPASKEPIYHLGMLHKELRQWDNARFHLERLISMKPGYKFLRAYVDLLEVYLELGLHYEAQKLAQMMTQYPDGSGRLDYYRGMAYYRLKDYDKAKANFERQCGRDFKRTQSYLMLGKIYYLEGKYNEAESLFRQVLELNPWSAEAHYNLAVILEKDGRFAEASELLERVLIVNPFSIDTSVRLVKLYNHLASRAKRTELLRKLFRLKPDSPGHFYLMASENKDIGQMLRGYKQEFVWAEPSSTALRARAIIATLTGDLREAINYYQGYYETLESRSHKQRIEREVTRLEALLRGEETLKTPA